MMVKLVSGGVDRTFECSCVQVKHLPNRIEIEMGPSNKTVALERAGDAAYIMNDSGRTVDAYRWPSKDADIAAGGAQ